MENKKIGNPDDTKCKDNSMRHITRKVCRNNCKFWEHAGKRKGFCGLGY